MRVVGIAGDASETNPEGLKVDADLVFWCCGFEPSAASILGDLRQGPEPRLSRNLASARALSLFAASPPPRAHCGDSHIYPCNAVPCTSPDPSPSVSISVSYI